MIVRAIELKAMNGSPCLCVLVSEHQIAFGPMLNGNSEFCGDFIIWASGTHGIDGGKLHVMTSISIGDLFDRFTKLYDTTFENCTLGYKCPNCGKCIAEDAVIRKKIREETFGDRPEPAEYTLECPSCFTSVENNGCTFCIQCDFNLSDSSYLLWATHATDCLGVS